MSLIICSTTRRLTTAVFGFTGGLNEVVRYIRGTKYTFLDLSWWYCACLSHTLLSWIITKRKHYLYYSALDPVNNPLFWGENTQCCFELSFCVLTTGLVMRRIPTHQLVKWIFMLHPVKAQIQGGCLFQWFPHEAKHVWQSIFCYSQQPAPHIIVTFDVLNADLCTLLTISLFLFLCYISL